MLPIAVLDFEPFGISESDAIALTNRLRNEIFRSGSFKVVERGMMRSILEEQDFQFSGCTSDECLVEVGRLLGARQIIGGSISKVAGTLTVSARMVDVETGEVLSVSDYDLKGELDDMLTYGMRAVAATLLGSDEKLQGPSLRDLYKPQDDSYKGGIQISLGMNQHAGIGAAPGPVRRIVQYSYHLGHSIKVRNRDLFLSVSLTNVKLNWSSSDQTFSHRAEGWSISLFRQWRFVYLRTVGQSYSAGIGVSKMSHFYMNNADSSREVEENGVGLVISAGTATYFLSPLPGIPRLSLDIRFSYDTYLKQYYTEISIGMLLFGRAD